MNKSFFKCLAASVAACSLGFFSAEAQVTFNIDAGLRGAMIGDRHYGLFFEEINHAGDGGLYAELIQNRSFEDNAANPDKWWTVGDARMELTTDGLLNEVQGHALQLTFRRAGDGVRNEGFWGINIVEGQTYKLSFWIKGNPSYEGTLTASLQDADGQSLGDAQIQVAADGTWTKQTAEITATGNARDGWFALTGSEAGTVCLDVVSLFPPTYKDRENGCRRDLAEMLESMNPSFVRFPGGCYVEGVWANGRTNRFEWKNTIGPIEERPGHMNQNWGYRVSDGLGFHEMLQLTEDLGAEPLFVVNMGMGHGWAEDYTQIDEYIQEALDAIEYCNGDAETTTWGALRARNGHPEPFNLRLIEIGNENYNFTSADNRDQSDHYAERYWQFYQAIREKYPEVTIIGNVEAWGTDNPSWRNPYPVDAVDEHYYRNPSWFVNQYNKYDTYSRANHKVYVGEYAVTQDYGVNGHLNAALGEAVFMLGMENNSDVCIMNSYAPIFVNENNYNWRPDMIRFNSYTCYGTPSYYVQQLFPNNVGRQNVKWTEENNTQSASSAVGLSTWSTTAAFDNVRVTAADGTELFSDDFSSVKPEWSAGGGRWATSGGVLSQNDANMQGNIYVCNLSLQGDYTFEVDATKRSGAEGFLIAFNYEDSDNYCWWNLGGWNNTQHGVEVCTDGVKSTVASVSGALETDRTYHIRIVVQGTRVQCFLDDVRLHDFILPMSRKVYASANIDDEAGMMYVKLVNPGAEAQSVTLNLANASVTDGTAIVLTSANGTDENDLANPQRVSPQESALDVSGQQLQYEVPAYSVNILRLQVDDVQLQPDEPATLPDPLVQYSFENGSPADDGGRFEGQLRGDAAVVTMDDGAKALYTGTKGGYADLGADMARSTLAALTGDYTLTVDVALPAVGTLGQYCWLYAFSQGTDSYIGMVNTEGNTNWYYTVKDDVSRDVPSGAGLSYGVWHTLTYVQSGQTGRLYVDGFLAGTEQVELQPADFAAGLTSAVLGRSPFASDALMSGVYIDNFCIYGEALDEEQVSELYSRAEGRSAVSADVAVMADVSEVSGLLKKFNFLHSAVTELPGSLQNGTEVEWSFTAAEGADGYVELADGCLSVVRRPEGDRLMAGTLTGLLHTADGDRTLQQQVWLAPDDGRYGYLYCFMNANEEITNFALGTEADKGKVFNVLLDGAEVFNTAEIAGIEGGTRDAYIGRGEEADGYFITTTDMRQHTSGVWNNYGINLVRSKDLIHWESSTFDFRKGKAIFSDPQAATGVYDTDEEYALINRVWAPQFIWDKDYNGGKGAYLVYYSILSANEGDDHDRIFYSYTDREFRTLTQPRVFFDPGLSVIDADIVYNPYDSLYHMYYKREGASGTARGVYEATSPQLVGGEWTDVMHVTNEGSEQVEGASTVRRINEDVYNLYYMRYSGGSAYKWCETDHLGLNVSMSSDVEGTGNFQHGSVMTVTEEEYRMLQAWSGVTLLSDSVRALLETGAESQVLQDAVAGAEEALAKTTVEELAVALPEAYAGLKAAVEKYTQDICDATPVGGEADLTYLLVNPRFSDGDKGWDGTAFSAASEGVAEFYDTTYDTYQVLQNMPAGDYRFSCQGFYRNGDYVDAYPAHLDGSEQLLAVLYVNEVSQPFMSLFDDSAPYTYTPYTYPDNVTTANTAFNRDGAYVGNEVKYGLQSRGTLRLGVAKSVYWTHDWNCFDNFRLIYAGNPSAIQDVTADALSPVDVYTLSGVKVRSAVFSDKAAEGLPKGIYIVGQRKIVVH